MPIEIKYSKAVFKLSFLTKANKICNRDYLSINMSNKYFYFVYQYFVYLFSQVPIFQHFNLKVDSNAHFDSAFSNIWSLPENIFLCALIKNNK